MDAWPPQASYPYGNFSDTSSFKFRKNNTHLPKQEKYMFTKGSLGHAFTANICTENISQINYWPSPLL